jgi:hypothetical protein
MFVIKIVLAQDRPAPSSPGVDSVQPALATAYYLPELALLLPGGNPAITPPQADAATGQPNAPWEVR